MPRRLKGLSAHMDVSAKTPKDDPTRCCNTGWIADVARNGRRARPIRAIAAPAPQVAVATPPQSAPARQPSRKSASGRMRRFAAQALKFELDRFGAVTAFEPPDDEVAAREGLEIFGEG